MEKKKALLLLLQDSMMVTDAEKKKIFYKIHTFTSEQIDALGTLLSYEQQCLLENKERILKQTKLLMNTLELVS